MLDLTVDGGTATPVIVKDVQNHPVRGEAIHLDLLRVDMNQPIHAIVVLELTGGDEAPGVTEGGVLSQETRELNIEALPDDIPDSITHDVSDAGDERRRSRWPPSPCPTGVTLLDDPEETVIATITPPTQEPVEEEIETETELVGEDGEPIEGAEGEEGARREAEGDAGDEAAPPRTTRAEALLVHPGRLAGRRARQPGPVATRTPRTTSASTSPTS